MGLGRNDRVALVLPQGPEMAMAFLAVAAGATCAPLNPAYRANEFDFFLADLHAQALMIQSGMDSPARAIAQARGLPIIELSPVYEAEAGSFTLTGERRLRPTQSGFAQPGDVALVIHTSGTTSRPKIVRLTQTNICTSAHNMRVALELVERRPLPERIAILPCARSPGIPLDIVGGWRQLCVHLWLFSDRVLCCHGRVSPDMVYGGPHRPPSHPGERRSAPRDHCRLSAAVHSFSRRCFAAAGHEGARTGLPCARD